MAHLARLWRFGMLTTAGFWVVGALVCLAICTVFIALAVGPDGLRLDQLQEQRAALRARISRVEKDAQLQKSQVAPAPLDFVQRRAQLDSVLARVASQVGVQRLLLGREQGKAQFASAGEALPWMLWLEARYGGDQPFVDAGGALVTWRLVRGAAVKARAERLAGSMEDTSVSTGARQSLTTAPYIEETIVALGIFAGLVLVLEALMNPRLRRELAQARLGSIRTWKPAVRIAGWTQLGLLAWFLAGTWSGGMLDEESAERSKIEVLQRELATKELRAHPSVIRVDAPLSGAVVAREPPRDAILPRVLAAAGSKASKSRFDAQPAKSDDAFDRLQSQADGKVLSVRAGEFERATLRLEGSRSGVIEGLRAAWTAARGYDYEHLEIHETGVPGEWVAILALWSEDAVLIDARHHQTKRR